MKSMGRIPTESGFAACREDRLTVHSELELLHLMAWIMGYWFSQSRSC